MELINWDPEIFSPTYWHKSASDLSKSAKVICDKIISINKLPAFGSRAKDYINDSIAYYQSYSLLMGYSIENSLKGYAIEKYISENIQNKITSFDMLMKDVWKTREGHDLIKLLDNFNITITSPEDLVLSRYKQFTIWAGKYHIPKDSKTYYENTYKNKFGYIHYDQKVIKGLFSKIESSLMKK